MIDTTINQSKDLPKHSAFMQGVVAMLPLSLAVIPWGILAGSFAIEAGLSVLESQAMSAILFAGSAQLVVTGMLKTDAGLLSMLFAVFVISARHLLYSISMRSCVKGMPLRWRLSLGFLLTDELFAVCAQQSKKCFDRWYALGAGLSFYLLWNVASFLGIVLGNYIPDINHLGLEFAVAATFIALVVPQIKSLAVLMCVLTASTLSVVLSTLSVESSLIWSSLFGMIAGYYCERRQESRV